MANGRGGQLLGYLEAPVYPHPDAHPRVLDATIGVSGEIVEAAGVLQAPVDRALDLSSNDLAVLADGLHVLDEARTDTRGVGIDSDARASVAAWASAERGDVAVDEVLLQVERDLDVPGLDAVLGELDLAVDEAGRQVRNIDNGGGGPMPNEPHGPQTLYFILNPDGSTVQLPGPPGATPPAGGGQHPGETAGERERRLLREGRER